MMTCTTDPDYSLDVSIPHYLEINSWCDGIPGVGDFYETLLTTPYYHARINLHNQFNGNQVGEPLRIPLEMVKQGKPLRLQIWRLYRNFEGIENHHEVKAPFEDGKYTREEIIDVEIPLTGLLGRSVEDRPICHGEDFHQHEWTGGFWWRTEEMDEAWTFYLANCKAKKFTTDQASECLAGKSLVYLGDSTSEGESMSFHVACVNSLLAASGGENQSPDPRYDQEHLLDPSRRYLSRPSRPTKVLRPQGPLEHDSSTTPRKVDVDLTSFQRSFQPGHEPTRDEFIQTSRSH